MSVNKYANLPDIDTAPDIYETDDVLPSAHANKGDSSDEDSNLPTRRGRIAEPGAGREELDGSHLISPDEASKKFKKAERWKRDHRSEYVYPRSRTRSLGPSRSRSHTPPRAKPLAQRLRALQSELSLLEADLADPSNPMLRDESVDPGALILGLVDVRGRLERIRHGKEGRGRLVSVVTGEEEHVKEQENGQATGEIMAERQTTTNKPDAKTKAAKEEIPEARTIVEMDKRVGELEKLVGSSSATLDESSPLPPPLLPLVTRLSTQLTLLTQPRHIDSISRRLKLLQSDLERASAQSGHRQTASSTQPNGANSQASTTEQLVPLINRLSPSLPHIPHILARLRTLSALHASASEFNSTLTGLEEEQRRVRAALAELKEAMDSVERSLDENKRVVAGNVTGLEERVDSLVRRLEEVTH